MPLNWVVDDTLAAMEDISEEELSCAAATSDNVYEVSSAWIYEEIQKIKENNNDNISAFWFCPIFSSHSRYVQSGYLISKKIIKPGGGFVKQNFYLFYFFQKTPRPFFMKWKRC
jgi:hypothetical protein